MYFNVIKAVRITLDELEYDFSLHQKEDSNGITEVAVASSSSSPAQNLEYESKRDLWEHEINQLRINLLPLLALEDTLAAELSGGVSNLGGGRTGVYVRTGWQALVTTTWSIQDTRAKRKEYEMIGLAVQTLGTTADSIRALWQHRAVKRLLELKKLRLNESAPL